MGYPNRSIFYFIKETHDTQSNFFHMDVYCLNIPKLSHLENTTDTQIITQKHQEDIQMKQQWQHLT